MLIELQQIYTEDFKQSPSHHPATHLLLPPKENFNCNLGSVISEVFHPEPPPHPPPSHQRGGIMRAGVILF